MIAVGGAADLLYRKVYNHLTLPAMALGVILSYWYFGGEGLKDSGLGLAVGFLPMFLFFLAGGMGGGDVKLMAAIGAIMGYPFILSALIYSALTGGVIALAAVIWKGQWRSLGSEIGQAWDRLLHPLARRDPEIELDRRPRLTIPYGFAIFLGSLWAWLESRYFTLALG